MPSRRKCGKHMAIVASTLAKGKDILLQGSHEYDVSRCLHWDIIIFVNLKTPMAWLLVPCKFFYEWKQDYFYIFLYFYISCWTAIWHVKLIVTGTCKCLYWYLKCDNVVFAALLVTILK